MQVQRVSCELDQFARGMDEESIFHRTIIRDSVFVLELTKCRYVGNGISVKWDLSKVVEGSLLGDTRSEERRVGKMWLV